MRLVAATRADRLARAVVAESWGAGSLAVGHDDGSVSLYDRHLALQLLWLNPGETLVSLTAVDAGILAAFESGVLRLLAADTGLVVAETRLSFAAAGVHVLADHLVCWAHLAPRVWILERSNLDVRHTLAVDSPVLSVCAVSRALTVICFADVYTLRPRDGGARDGGARDGGALELRRVLQTATPLVAGTVLNHRWLLVRANRWSLCALAEGASALDEEFTVDAPADAQFCGAVPTPLGVFLRCTTPAVVLVRESNIQVLPAPRGAPGAPGAWTCGAAVVWPDLGVSEARAQRGEVVWLERRLPAEVSAARYLPGESDPAVTARWGAYVGTVDGRVNGVAALPAAVLRIDADGAHSVRGSVPLPLRALNVVTAPRAALRDARTAVATVPYGAGENALVGIAVPEWTTLRPAAAQLSAPLLALRVLEGHAAVADVLAATEGSLTAVAQLEDLAVMAAGRDDAALCRTVAAILDKMWTSRRVAELLRSAGPRSLQVLSAVYPHIGVAADALQAMLASMLDGARPQREAVLWVFEHQRELVHDVVTPFAALRGLSEETVSRFAETMAVRDSTKLLRDARAVVVADGSGPQLAPVPAGPAGDDPSAESQAKAGVMTALLAALSSPGPSAFPPSDRALADLVALVAPAMHQRVPGAKKILAKLLSQSQVQYHQGQQRLLVPTPSEPGQAALVFEFGDASNDPLVLRKPAVAVTTAAPGRSGEPALSSMVFGVDGKTVHAPAPRGRYVWHFGGALRALFRSRQPIEPVLEQ